jgi:hypothetical protein
MTFGQWLVLRRAPKLTGSTSVRWTCRCDCGTERHVQGWALRNGMSTSCGCARSGRAHLKAHTIVPRQNRRGLSGTPEYACWVNLLHRCLNSDNPWYANYGGRGITVAGSWREEGTGFMAFLSDVGKRPGAGYSLDRIDNDGAYAPGNVRWATKGQQNANRRRKDPDRPRKSTPAAAPTGTPPVPWVDPLDVPLLTGPCDRAFAHEVDGCLDELTLAALAALDGPDLVELDVPDLGVFAGEQFVAA